jgi:hypothetical protein
MLRNVSSRAVNMFSKWVLCYFACLIGLDVPLLQIQMHCFKANRTTDITLHEVRNYLSTMFHYMPQNPKKCLKWKSKILMRSAFYVIYQFFLQWAIVEETSRVEFWLHENQIDMDQNKIFPTIFGVNPNTKSIDNSLSSFGHDTCRQTNGRTNTKLLVYFRA